MKLSSEGDLTIEVKEGKLAAGELSLHGNQCESADKVTITLDKSDWWQIRGMLTGVITHGFKGHTKQQNEIAADNAAVLHALINEALGE